MADVQQLVEMGFPRDKVEYAMKVTNNKGVEPAMEWLLAHADEELPASMEVAVASTDETGPSTSTTGDETAESNDAAEAKSLKCDDCGKLCKDHAEVEFHAAKTGHSNFSESTEEKKPLTEEEKKAQLALIEEKLKLKRREREDREKKEELEREKNRIKSGKDMTEARKRMEEIEMQKIIEQRKREKAEEKAARERVRAQIEADKAARKAREQNQSDITPPAVTSTTTTSPTTVKSSPKDYTETRIQVRLQDGTAIMETFSVKEQLSAVRVFVQMKTGSDAPFNLMTSYPRKVFDEEDFEKPLDALGLVPSAVLIVTNAKQLSYVN